MCLSIRILQHPHPHGNCVLKKNEKKTKHNAIRRGMMTMMTFLYICVEKHQPILYQREQKRQIWPWKTGKTAQKSPEKKNQRYNKNALRCGKHTNKISLKRSWFRKKKILCFYLDFFIWFLINYYDWIHTFLWASAANPDFGARLTDMLIEDFL